MIFFKDTECSSPPPLPNAISKVKFYGPEKIYVPDTKVMYICFDGYIMSPQSYKGVICGKNGNYSALTTDFHVTSGECVPSKCLIFVEIYDNY